jgi:glycosyltransferase involved in cell wall biosynthesis
MVKVLVVGQTPPPLNGQGIMIQGLVNSELPGVEIIHVRMAFSSNMDELGRVRLSKVLHLFSLIAQIIYHRFADGVKILYYPPAGPERVPVVRDLVILLATRWLFQKTIFHFHAGGVSKLYATLPRWQQWLFRRAYFHADAAIRLSEFNPEDGRMMDAKREYLIPNGIVDACPEYATSSFPADRSKGAMRVLYVGVMSEAKGVNVLVEACGTLAARQVPFEVEMMGQWESPSFAEKVKSRIQELNLGSHFKFLGVQHGADKNRSFERADLFCFPTHFECETFGLGLLEAMSFGLPVVASNWRGIPSVVDEGESGFLFEPCDAEALAERLARFSADHEMRERMGHAGRAKFEREFTFARHASRMRRAILETAGVAVEADSEVEFVPVLNQHSQALEPACI